MTLAALQTWDLDGTNAHRPFAVEAPGHRSDVRCIALSPDDSLLLSASSNSVKIWHPLTAACLHTIDSGYGLAALFAPGQKHAVLGTKEGNLELFDIGASSLLASIRAHEGAVWSLASLPDSRWDWWQCELVGCLALHAAVLHVLCVLKALFDVCASSQLALLRGTRWLGRAWQQCFGASGTGGTMVWLHAEVLHGAWVSRHQIGPCAHFDVVASS